jgi:hypothetical protein
MSKNYKQHLDLTTKILNISNLEKYLIDELNPFLKITTKSSRNKFIINEIGIRSIEKPIFYIKLNDNEPKDISPEEISDYFSKSENPYQNPTYIRGCFLRFARKNIKIYLYKFHKIDQESGEILNSIRKSL